MIANVRPLLKTIAFLLAGLLPIAVASGEIPSLINYQGYLEDSSGNPLTGNYNLTFAIYDLPTGGSPLWSEIQAGVPINNGLFVALLGSVNPVADSTFDGTERYLGITIGADPQLLPRQRITSIAFAYKVGSINGASGGNITSSASIGPAHTISGENTLVVGQDHDLAGDHATIAGGFGNTVTQGLSIVGAGSGNRAEATFSGVLSGVDNVTSETEAAVVAGEANEAAGRAAFIGAGAYNNASGNYSFIGGGGDGSSLRGNIASGEQSVVVGGEGNRATGFRSFAGGGINNEASGQYSFVGGGGLGSSGTNNVASGEASVVVGGFFNKAQGFRSFVGTGSLNIASGTYAFVGGGRSNQAGQYAFVGGGGNSAGSGNSALGFNSAIVGGNANFIAENTIYSSVGGGRSNAIHGDYTAILGGYDNDANGDYSAVAGGRLNIADGDYSLAAGHSAHTLHHGSFVWSDSTSDAFASTAENQFLIEAANGVGVNTNNPQAPLHIKSEPGSGKEILRLEMERSWAFRQKSAGANTSLSLVSLTPGSKDFLIITDGNVGIGTDAPSEKLMVKGNFCATGTIGACSDGRFKTNIHSIEKPIELIEQLQGVTYNWRQEEFAEYEFTDEEQLGFVAQDVVDVLPEVVSQGDDGYYSIDYGKLTPLLVEALKEMNSELRQQREIISALQNEIEAVKANN